MYAYKESHIANATCLHQWKVCNQDTIGGQYEFRSFVICREVVIFWEVLEL